MRYWHTVKYLKPIQIYGRIWFRLYRPRPNLSPAPTIRKPSGKWIEPARVQPSLVGPKEFLLCGKRAELGSVGWDGPQMPRLWRYEQHCFKDLVAQDSAARRDWHEALIRRWIQENLPGSGVGWESYPISRRIINWIEWAIEGGRLDDQAVHSLAVQARWLERRLEWHLLANHLLANAIALIFAGVFFDGAEADRWLSCGVRLLDQQLNEQILEDGGHFELSSMYHAIILRDMLDLYNLTGVYSQLVVLQMRRHKWAQIINRMRAWLLALSHPDGDISFFNDAALGVAPSTVELQAYASRLGFLSMPGPEDGLTHLRQSGYVRIQANRAVAVIDCGAIGPDYQPGHAHADTLSFELSVAGRRVLVNSGTSTYEPGQQRAWQRGTAAHNTVTIDGQDSSEVWSVFRVARRARVVRCSIGQDGPVIAIQAEHDGYRWQKGRPMHRRLWTWSSRGLVIDDQIRGRFGQAEARFYIHPDFSMEYSDSAGIARGPSGVKLRYKAEKGRARVVGAYYYPLFGRSVPTSCLVVSAEGGQARVSFSWD